MFVERFIQQKIGELETSVAQHRFAAAQLERSAEQRAGEAQRVEFATFAARVDAGRQGVEQGGIVVRGRNSWRRVAGYPRSTAWRDGLR